jgi:hypothetical protein
MLKFDDNTFEQTAAVLWRINSSVRDKFQDTDHLRSFMESMAYQYLTDSHFFSTAGFCLTAYDRVDGVREVVATVQTYTVHRFVSDLLATLGQ